MTNKRIDAIRIDFDRELHIRSGGYPGLMRRAAHATSLVLIAIVMALVFFAMLGGLPMSQGLQLAAIMIAPLAFIAFLSWPSS